MYIFTYRRANNSYLIFSFTSCLRNEWIGPLRGANMPYFATILNNWFISEVLCEIHHLYCAITG